MTLLQNFRDRMRVMNKQGINKILIHIAGKRIGHFAVLTHTGRRSGKTYRIPIIAEPVEGGFMIAMTYGRKTDWAANVLAADACTLRWKNSDYSLRAPEFVDRETGLRAFPAVFRTGLRAMGISDFMKLSKSPNDQNLGAEGKGV